MYVAYDKKTGEIKGVVGAAGSRPNQIDAWESAGLGVCKIDKAPAGFKLNDFFVVEGKLSKKTPPSSQELLAAAKAKKYAQVSQDYEQYVEGLGYTAAWQRTAQAQRLALQRVLADPKATDKQKAAAQAVESRFAALEEFLVVTLGLYFAQVGQAIFAARSLTQLEEVSWDFGQFDDQDPDVTMHIDVFPGLAVAKGKDK